MCMEENNLKISLALYICLEFITCIVIDDQMSDLCELNRQSMFYIGCSFFSCLLTPTPQLSLEIHGQHAFNTVRLSHDMRRPEFRIYNKK